VSYILIQKQTLYDQIPAMDDIEVARQVISLFPARGVVNICPICIDDISNPVMTPCAHTFDMGCLQAHLEHSATCPICRQSIIQFDEYVCVAMASDVNGSASPDRVRMIHLLVGAGGRGFTSISPYSEYYPQGERQGEQNMIQTSNDK
jgi:hypothetical protein